MKIRNITACAALLSLTFAAATPSQAADKAKGGNAELSLPSMQLGDLSLKLDTDEPKQAGVPDPSGLATMRQDSVQTFVGFRLSGPLPDNFWDFAR